MQIRLGPMVTAASGTIGTVTFVSAGPRAYARRAQHKIDKPTPATLDARRAFTKARARWLALADDTKTAWNEYAKRQQIVDRLGLARNPSGMQLYLRKHIPHIRNGDTFTDLPPYILNATQVWVTSIVFNSGGPYNITFPAQGTVTTLQIFGARSCSKTGFRNYRWHWLGQFTAVMGAPTVLNVYPQWTPLMGDMAYGEWYAIRYHALRYPAAPWLPWFQYSYKVV